MRNETPVNAGAQAGPNAEPLNDEQLRRLVGGDAMLLEAAEEAGVALDELCRALTADGSPARASLERLAEAHALLLPAVLGRAKLIAARCLRELAQDDEHPETARKACVDLLKLSPSVGPASPRSARTRPAGGEPDEALSDEAKASALAALERMGAAVTADPYSRANHTEPPNSGSQLSSLNSQR